MCPHDYPATRLGGCAEKSEGYGPCASSGFTAWTKAPSSHLYINNYSCTYTEKLAQSPLELLSMHMKDNTLQFFSRIDCSTECAIPSLKIMSIWDHYFQLILILEISKVRSWVQEQSKLKFWCSMIILMIRYELASTREIRRWCAYATAILAYKLPHLPRQFAAILRWRTYLEQRHNHSRLGSFKKQIVPWRLQAGGLNSLAVMLYMPQFN